MPSNLVKIDGVEIPTEEGPFLLDEDDFLLFGLLLDAVYHPEIAWSDPENYDYHGQYRVRDYQYEINRIEDNRAIIACARSVGKTESEKVHAQIHPLKNYGKLLITAPELIHLLPLTDAVEDSIRESPLLREFLDTRYGQTGFTHRPFACNFIDGSKIIGRIPKLNGTGVKSMHQNDLIVEEGQDYPVDGWTELEPTVNYEAKDIRGQTNYHYWIYGVHSGNKSSGFDERARNTAYRKVKVTALRKPDWGPSRKQAAIAGTGGTSTPDYKRNYLGEPGSGATAYFVTARVMSCVDQHKNRGEDEPGSEYNDIQYLAQKFRVEEMDDLGMDITDLMDIPDLKCDGWWAGVDVGLTESPTVITLFAEGLTHEKKRRLALVRRYTLERFRTKQIRHALYALGLHFGSKLLGVGIDVTGLGFPIWQEMEDDELAPPHLLDVSAGYTFNSLVEVGVSPDMITENQGVLRDALGNMVKLVEDQMTGEKWYVTVMPFIAASTRYIREEIDAGEMLLPFDTDVISDFLQETKQRVEKIGKRGESGFKQARKGDKFHILDAVRAMAYRRRQDEIIASLAPSAQVDVLDGTAEVDWDLAGTFD